jgi:hypothetical protein
MNADWLAQLAPEHAPASPGWWPPAPGWWIAAALCLCAIGVWCSWRFAPRMMRGRALRGAALAELERIRAGANEAAAPAIQRLLRRYALTVFDRGRVAPLTGEAWVRFLADHGGTAFADGEGRTFLAAAFGGEPAAAPRESWLAAAEGFIRRAPRRTAGNDA